LTAVFALAVGTVVAFAANPGREQPRAHVYLLRGLMNIFSLGMDTKQVRDPFGRRRLAGC
jgi:hypothetical protein